MKDQQRETKFEASIKPRPRSCLAAVLPYDQNQQDYDQHGKYRIYDKAHPSPPSKAAAKNLGFLRGARPDYQHLATNAGAFSP